MLAGTTERWAGFSEVVINLAAAESLSDHESDVGQHLDTRLCSSQENAIHVTPVEGYRDGLLKSGEL